MRLQSRAGWDLPCPVPCLSCCCSVLCSALCSLLSALLAVSIHVCVCVCVVSLSFPFFFSVENRSVCGKLFRKCSKRFGMDVQISVLESPSKFRIRRPNFTAKIRCPPATGPPARLLSPLTSRISSTSHTAAAKISVAPLEWGWKIIDSQQKNYSQFIQVKQ